MDDTTLVIGSNSFTGAHFVNTFLSQTAGQIIGVSRSEEYDATFLPYSRNPRAADFSFHQLDVNKNLNEILDLCDEHRPAYVANFSAQGEVRNSWRFPDHWFETNCMAVVRLTNELSKRNYLKKYITSSTPEVYGSTTQGIVENHHYYPSTPYAASKLAGDLHLITLFKHCGFPVVFTRAANVYGIHQQLYRIIPRTIIYLKMGKTLELHGQGRSLRSFVHIRDVADATLLGLEKGEPGNVYHIAPTTEPSSIRSLVESICTDMGYPFEDCVKLVDKNFGQDAMYSLNTNKIRGELGWDPKVSLDKGISEMIDWINEDWDKIKNLPLEYIHKP